MMAGLTHIGGAMRRVVKDLDVKIAARALIDRDCRYDGPNIVIPCADHGEAIRLVADLRRALEQAA
jgi:hypothetical protein